MSFDDHQICLGGDPWQGIPQQFNLGDALTAAQVEAGRGEKLALAWENAAGRTRTFTYRQLDALSNRLASSLTQLGVTRGDRVFLRLPNLPQFYIAALAIAKCGGVFIPSSTQFRAAEVQYRLRDSGAVAVVTTDALVDLVDQVTGNCPNLKHVIVVSDSNDSPSSGEHLNFDQLLNNGEESFTATPTAHDDIAFIAYTSGTTGDPKGVVHYQRYPIAYQSLLENWHDFKNDDIVACPSELGWLLPVASTFLFAMSRGLTVVLYDAQGGKFNARQWFSLFEKYRISNFTAPPTVYRMLMADADAAQGFDLSSWRHGVAAGEPLPADTLESIRRRFGVALLDGIGMSECMVYCCNMVGSPIKPGSCGRPTPGTMIQLLDENLQPTPDGEEGVLCLRRDTHPGMMKEYWNKPDRTAEIFRGDWYYSGDVLVRDADGYFHFKGRADDVINASGYRISPFEVENCLVAHPAVLEAAAVESPDPMRGMIVKAYLVLRSGFDPSDQLAAEIQEHAKRTIAPYKYPRLIEFADSLPKTTSGKIKRKDLRNAARGE